MNFLAEKKRKRRRKEKVQKVVTFPHNIFEFNTLFHLKRNFTIFLYFFDSKLLKYIRSSEKKSTIFELNCSFILKFYMKIIMKFFKSTNQLASDAGLLNS